MSRRPIGALAPIPVVMPPAKAAAKTEAQHFDFDSEEKGKELRALAAKMQTLGRKTVQVIVEVGETLAHAKALIRHGEFCDFVELECGLALRDAQRFMQVAQRFPSKNDKSALLGLGVSAVYLLTAPSTPVSVREDVIAEVEDGSTPSYTEVAERVAAAKKAERPPPAPTPPDEPELEFEGEPESKSEPDRESEPGSEASEEGDSEEEESWRRGLLYRAAEAADGATYEEAWREFAINDEVIEAAKKASVAWSKLAKFLQEHRH